MRSLRFLLVLLFAAFSSAALVLADAGALGQNANSSTTEEPAQDANMNANMSAPRRGRGRRGGRRNPPQAEQDIAVIAPVAAQDDDSRGDLSGERVDLSGTYSGRVTTAGGHEMSGDAELTISGNTFTLTGEGMTHNGRFYAVLTRGATSAALYFNDIQDPTTSTPLVFNVRARKSGDRLTLTPAPNTRNKLTFTPARGRR
ncbi:MAG: hypothetical protein ABW208_22420 [Pyrinomonadaceae bacterium]